MSEVQQKDLVLSINEYAYVRDNTKGNISCWVGPTKTSLSSSDDLVSFNTKKKCFEKCSYSEAIKLFTTAPENWYVILKNPVEGNRHPAPKSSNELPENVNIGRKVNIRGPVSFALYPGQMAKVIRGHALRSNQYLLARVYEAKSANEANNGEILDTEGNKISKETNYVNGQILVIKGTEVSFYIPPTGIEVIPVDNQTNNGYIRDAVTLERLEYCILKDEDGNKRYVHGPEVVFPKPTETFITSPKGGYIFKAIELSKISGIYVKVIAEYDEGKIHHPVGEELFITGEQQMIYYPRPEHAIISYDGKLMHHAIAIPEGEGRYVMNRLTGEIKTVHGPAMYLPDPRVEVIVKRKLSRNECQLLYPGNREALEYNLSLTEKSVEKSLVQDLDPFTTFMATNSIKSSLANLEANANISRGTSYTKPRTITLDNKYEGVVTVDVWTGYAVNVVSKNGERRVVCGPQTILLDYDQTLSEMQMSTGKPKTTDELIYTAYLRHENNKISDIIDIETKDFVKAKVTVSYCVDFDKDYMDKWFNVENYVKYLCDRERSLIKRAAKNYTIEEFYQNYSEIVRNIAINANDQKSEAEAPERHVGRFFLENGMYVYDTEVLGISVEDSISRLLTTHQYEMVRQGLELSDAEKRISVSEKLAEAEQKEQELNSQKLLNSLALEEIENTKRLAIRANMVEKESEITKASKQAQKDLDVIITAIEDAKLAREKKAFEQELAQKQALADVEKSKQEAYASMVASIMGSIQPDLVAAMSAQNETELMKSIGENISPYALAEGKSVDEFISTLFRGTTLESVVNKFGDKQS